MAVGTVNLAAVGSALAAHRATSPRGLCATVPRATGETVKPATFRTAGGLTLHCRFPPHPATGAIVIARGFAMSRHEILDPADGLRARRHAGLLCDFRCHGVQAELAGRPSGEVGSALGAATRSLQAAARSAAADSAFVALQQVVIGMWTRYPLPPPPSRRSPSASPWRACADIHAARPVDAAVALAVRPLLVIHIAGVRHIPAAPARGFYTDAGASKALRILRGADHSAAWRATVRDLPAPAMRGRVVTGDQGAVERGHRPSVPYVGGSQDRRKVPPRTLRRGVCPVPAGALAG